MAADVVSDLVPPPMTGRSLAGYHLEELLGAGGMGEVYRSRDAKLGRDVAIKILPRAFTSHPDRLARFEREARMLGALNHPNICAIYGFEEAVPSASSGQAHSTGSGQAPVRFLILELVDGETLAHRLADVSRQQSRGAGLPLREALTIARQIAEALEAAHDKGIIHRDLKPANIKITLEGIVKVLDFGLAKAVGGDGSSPDITSVPEATEGGMREGAVMGTAAYMSPEQARGLSVDKRTDIWAFGCVLYEMLTGRVAFAGDTTSDSIARILEREPDWSALPATTPEAIRRILFRCLAKNPKQRVRDIGDVRIEIDALDEALPGSNVAKVPSPYAWLTWLPWVALLALGTSVVVREGRRQAPPVPLEIAADPLANATFSRFTDWPGTEERAEISPDGRFVAFLADKAGQLDLWRGQVGTGDFYNLTPDIKPMVTPGNLLRSLGFSGDGSEIWFSLSGNPAQQKVLMPLTGGVHRPFLGVGRSTPSWSPDNARLVYIHSGAPGEPSGDPLFIADHIGADARPIEVPDQGPDQNKQPFFRIGRHTHNPVWSPDGEWIYVVHGPDPFGDMDVWRLRPSGESPEQLTHQNAPVNFLVPVDARTLLYVARAEDWSGPWLWALDVETRVTRRVTRGLEQYTSVAASRDGRRVVATVANPTTSLSRVPLRDRLVTDGDAPYPLPTERALAPRFGGTSLFYLSRSTRGPGDGLWRVQNEQAFEVRKGADGVVSEPPAPSPDGSRVAVVVRRQGKRHLAIMSSDGTNSRTLAPSIEVEGVAGQGTVDWSPDGAWIVTGGRNAEGPGLFKIPVDGIGEPVRLVPGQARGPVWSPSDDLIVYGAPRVAGAGGSDALRGVRSDGTPVPMPEVAVRIGGAHRFLRNGTGLVYLPGVEAKDFWLLDLATKKPRRITEFTDRGFLSTFDVTPDGKYLVFDRTRQNSDIVLIELPAK
jgi:serine/threonine protein kinase/Tol biopolymer transport system component